MARPNKRGANKLAVRRHAEGMTLRISLNLAYRKDLEGIERTR